MSAPCVQLELQNAEGKWVTGGSISIDEPPASLSSDGGPDGARHIYLFGWWEGRRGVWESGFGIDHGNSAVRQIVTTELVLLSDLSEPFELTFYRQGQPRHVRFRGEQ